MSKKIGILVGSLREGSFSMKIAQAVVKMAPKEFNFEIIPLDDLPIYNQDFDDKNRVPKSYIIFRDLMKAIEGIIFITPEYNRSIPSVLKNALDVGSRPYGKSVWDGKPAAIFSNSPGNLSAFGANHHLRQCLVFLNVPVMQQPEVYIANIADALDEDGNVTDKDVKGLLNKATSAYIDWFGKLS